MRFYVFCIVFFMSSTTFGQITIRGVVTDSINQPLELANVLVVNKKTDALESFAVSNNKGEYLLKLKKETAYSIKVSYVGMKTHEEDISVKNEDITKNIILYIDNTLAEIELTYDMPISVKGDTLTYKADAFTNGAERKLEDVLKKLPGVEVDNDGNIKVEGKEVKKVMVEGKDFFDGDSKLASKNIPADAVDKVQVLKDYEEVSQLKSVSNSDDIAMNIKLKEDKKNFWFGDITGGTGVATKSELHLANPKCFYYSPKYSANIIGNLNNIGEVPFTTNDYFKFLKFKLSDFESGFTLDDSLWPLTMPNDETKKIDSKFGAANVNYTINKNIDINGFVVVSKNQKELQNAYETTYNERFVDPINNQSIAQETSISNTHINNDLGMFRLSSTYKSNKNNQLDYDILGNRSITSRFNNQLSSVSGGVFQNNAVSSKHITQNLNYYYTLNENNIFALEAQHVIKRETPDYNAVIEEPLRYNSGVSLGLDGEQSNYDIWQQKTIKTNRLDVKLDYWNVLNTKSNINITLGTLINYQKYESDIYQRLDNSDTFYPIPNFNNGLISNNDSYRINDNYLGVHYKLKSGLFTVTSGANLHAIATKKTAFFGHIDTYFFRLLPDFNLRLQLKRSESIRLNYKMVNQFPQLTNLAHGIVLNNFNNIYYGNDNLNTSTAHRLNLSYHNFNRFNYTTIYANANYNKQIDQIIPINEFNNNVNVSTSINSNFADESLSLMGSFQREIGNLKGTLEGSFSYSKQNQVISQNRSINNNYSHSYKLDLNTNFANFPNFGTGINYRIQDNNQGNASTRFYTTSPHLSMDAYFFKSLIFKANYTFTNFSNSRKTINEFKILRASIAYKKNKNAKLEYQLVGTNLLDIRFQNNSNATSIAVYSRQYEIQPRYVTFRLTYSL